jgi:hypothetical protein
LSNVVTASGGGARQPESVIGFLVSEFTRADGFVAQIQQAALYWEADLNALVNLEQTDPLRRMVTQYRAMMNGPLKDIASMFVKYDQGGRDISAYYEEHVRPHTSNRLPED